MLMLNTVLTDGHQKPGEPPLLSLIYTALSWNSAMVLCMLTFYLFFVFIKYMNPMEKCNFYPALPSSYHDQNQPASAQGDDKSDNSKPDQVCVCPQ